MNINSKEYQGARARLLAEIEHVRQYGPHESHYCDVCISLMRKFHCNEIYALVDEMDLLESRAIEEWKEMLDARYAASHGLTVREFHQILANLNGVSAAMGLKARY